jgi:hypothetical protein
MSGGKSYVNFDSGLVMKTKYLTEPVAYFLGGIYVSQEEIHTRDSNFRIAPVRYNYGAASELEVASHYEYVKRAGSLVNGETIMSKNIRGTVLDTGKNKMNGFSTFFKVSTLDDLEAFIPTLKKGLQASSWDVRRCFLCGIYDGRGSADINKQNHNVRMLSVDCISVEIGDFLAEMLDDAGLQPNYNMHRDRLEGGNPRKNQLRIRDVDVFVQKVGLISPRRINILKQAYQFTYRKVDVIQNDDVLPGLKTLLLG